MNFDDSYKTWVISIRSSTNFANVNNNGNANNNNASNVNGVRPVDFSKHINYTILYSCVKRKMFR